MTGDGGLVRFSVGPYRLTSTEFMSVTHAAKPNRLLQIYNCSLTGLLTAFLQLSLWGIFVLILRVAFGPVRGAAVIASVAVAGVIAALVVLRVIGPAVLRGYFSGLSASRFDYTIKLYDDGARYSLGKLAVFLPWDAVDRVVDKRGCIFLFVDDYSAIIAPRRAFASAGNADTFLAFAQAQQAGARA